MGLLWLYLPILCKHQGIGMVGLDMYTWGIKDFHKCWSGSLAKRKHCLGPAGVINCTPPSVLSFWMSLFPGKHGYNTFSRRSSWPRGWTLVFRIAGKFITIWATSGPGASHTNVEHLRSSRVKWGGIRVGVLWGSVQSFQRTEAWHSIKVRIRPQREKTRFSLAPSCSTLCPWLSLSRFLKFFELHFPHQKNGAYKMKHSELFWRNRK